jgi:MFS family permease
MVGFCALYSVPAYAPSLQAAFGVSSASTDLVCAVSGFAAFSLCALSGWLADRFSPRLVSALGVTLIASGLLAASVSDDFIALLLSYGVLVGVGVGLSYVPAIAAVQKRFTTRRGVALGLAACGVGVGTALIAPLSQALEQFGDWRRAFAIAGMLVAIVGPPAVWMLGARKPAESVPCDERGDTGPPRHHPGTVTSSFARSDFWITYVSVFLFSVLTVIPITYTSISGTNRGITQQDALSLLSLVGMSSIAGRFMLATLADRFGSDSAFQVSCIGLALMTVGWLSAEGISGATAFAAFFGVFYGGFISTLPAFTADRFGSENAGSVLGVKRRGILTPDRRPIMGLTHF